MKHLMSIMAVLIFCGSALAQDTPWQARLAQWKLDPLGNRTEGNALIRDAATRADLDAVHKIVDDAEQAQIDDPDTPVSIGALSLERTYAERVAFTDGIAAADRIIEAEIHEWVSARPDQKEFVASTRLAFAWITMGLRDNPSTHVTAQLKALVIDGPADACPVPAHVAEAAKRIDDAAIAFEALLVACKRYESRAFWLTEGKAITPLVDLAINNDSLDMQRVIDALTAAKMASWVRAIELREAGNTAGADQMERAVNVIASVLAGLE